MSDIERANMSDIQYEEEKTKAENMVERQYQMRAYKYLQVANPANGEGFFRLVWDYDWSPANRNGPLSKDKLLVLATSRISNERCILFSKGLHSCNFHYIFQCFDFCKYLSFFRRQEILHDLIQVDRKAPKYIERFKDCPTLRRYLDREVYWRYLLEEAEVIVDDLRTNNGLELPDELANFFYLCREIHIDAAFSYVWPLIKTNSTKKNSPELEFSARRLIYR